MAAGVRHLLLAGVIALTCAGAAGGEASLLAAGYETQALDLRDTGGRWSRQDGSGFAASADWLWLVPPARWLWLTTDYGRWRLRDDDGRRLRLHRVDIGPALYADLLPVLIHVGAGVSVAHARLTYFAYDVSFFETGWHGGGHVSLGLALPLVHRFGLQGLVRYRRLSDHRTWEGRIGLSGWSGRLAVAYIPDGDSRLLNWRW